jgi:hypothetical protein
MGQEVICTMRRGRQLSRGKALLETAEIIFRAADGAAPLKIAFSAMKAVKAIDGQLRLETADGVIAFELGAEAEKWREKILHPKTRVEKLGVKAGMRISLLGKFDGGFLEELRDAAKKISDDPLDPNGELIFLGTDSEKELTSGIGKAVRSLKGATGLWIVYPKGRKEITENDVLTAGRKAGLKDVKVVGFSPTHTALKFVVPVAKR